MAAAEADAGGVARDAAGAGIGDGLGAAVRGIDVELPIGRNQLDELFLPVAPAPRQRKLRLLPPPARQDEKEDREEEVALPVREPGLA